MKKTIQRGVAISLFLILASPVWGRSHPPSFSREKIHFGDDRYATLMTGSKGGMARGQTGRILDQAGRPIGEFQVIGVDDFESVSRFQLEPDHRHGDIARFIRKDGLQVRYQIEDPRLFFTLDPLPGREELRRGMKGKLTLEGKESAIFKVVGIYRGKAVCQVTSNAANLDYRESDAARIQGYGAQILSSTGFANLHYKNLIMLVVGCLFLYLGIARDYEPLLLIPIGFGILIGNIPLPLQIFNSISVYMIDPITGQFAFNTTGTSVMGIIYYGVKSGLLPPLIFLGLGAMTDFTALLSNPKCVLLGAAAQTGIFITFITALQLGFSPSNAAAIGIIGGADGPTAIFLSSKLAPSLIGPIAIAAYSYMAMVPVIQPPIMNLLTTRSERKIRMKPGRKVSRRQKILFPIIGMVFTTLVAPGAIPLLGMLFFGNLLKESGVTTRLAKTAANALIDICTILLGVAVGASTSAQVFLNQSSVKIFVLGVVSFAVATATGVLFAKVMNLFARDKINPLIGAAGVSAVPDSARVANMVGLKNDPGNYLLMHAMGPNVAGVIGSAIAAGVFLGIF